MSLAAPFPYFGGKRRAAPLKSGAGSGYSSRADNGRRERLWVSPACLGVEKQGNLFEELG